MPELADLDGAGLLAAYRAGQASPMEAVASCLERIERLEPQVNAVVTLSSETCLEQARDSLRRWREGAPRPLEGLPVGLKDIIFTAGVRTTGGSVIYDDLVPANDAAVVERLRAAGALVLAKLQTYEFAMGDNSHYGPTRNPWQLDHTPGGSSTGSGAALAARELPLAVGTDTGGSIRVPASFCGVVGLKPTLGLVSRRGVMLQSWTLDHVGPMTRSVADAARMLAAMAGHDPLDPASIRGPAGGYQQALDAGVRGMRIGVPAEWFFDVVDPEIEAATMEALAILAERGASIVEVPLPSARHSDVIGWTIMYAEYAALHEDTFDRLEDYSAPLSQQILVSSQFVSAVDYARSLRALHLVQRDFEAAFEQVQALVVPGMVGVAPLLADMRFRIGDRGYGWGELVARTTMIFNLAGIPALSLPAGLHSSGLPMGIQVAARPFDETTCFQVGQAYEQATGHHLLAPPLLSA
jgi:aspartyl-tRNA(Asn)/glutamyl-tRNA(Gln) amidotransferase subunit A